MILPIPLIVVHRDEAGTLAVITSRLANYQINIAFMKTFREERGSRAITVIESDDFLPEELRPELTSYPSIEYVDLVEV